MEVEVLLLRGPQAELNGQVGHVIGYTQGRVAVQFPASRKALRAENLRPTGTQRLVQSAVSRADELRRAAEAERREGERAEAARLAEEEAEKARKGREVVAAARAAEKGPQPPAPAPAAAPAAAGGGVGRWYDKFDEIDVDEDAETQEARAEAKRGWRRKMEAFNADEQPARKGLREAWQEGLDALRERVAPDAEAARAREAAREERERRQAAIDAALDQVRGPVPAPPPGWAGKLLGRRRMSCALPPMATTLNDRTLVPGRLNPCTGRPVCDVPLLHVMEMTVREWAKGETATGPLLSKRPGDPPKPVLPPQLPSMPEQIPHPDAKDVPKTTYEVFRRPVYETLEEWVGAAQIENEAEKLDAYWRIVLRYSASGVCICMLRILRELRLRGWTDASGITRDGRAVTVSIDDWRMHTVEMVPSSLHYKVTKYETGHHTVELLEDSKGGLFCHQVLVNKGWVIDPAGGARGWDGHRGPMLRWLDFEQEAAASQVKLRQVCERTEWVTSEYNRWDKRIDAVVDAVCGRFANPPEARD